MPFRRLILAALTGLVALTFADAGEPVVRGAIRTTVLLGDSCLTVPAAETYLRPGTRLELRPCRNAPSQLFEWNVLSFEIKAGGLCVDAFRVGPGATRPGDPVGLWYCNAAEHQKWYPARKDERFADAFNLIVGTADSTLCMSVADPNHVDGARLELASCDGRSRQWFRLVPWPLEQQPAS